MTDRIDGVAYLKANRWDPELRNVHVCKTLAPNHKAEAALAMMERWGMVAGVPDGEDSAGRQKLRLATSEELVSRACEVADMAYAAFAERGWTLDIPLPEVDADTED